jgi:hypothetical protein
MSAGAWCELIKYSPEKGGGGKRHVALRKSVCLADAQVKPPHPLLAHNQAAKRHPKRCLLCLILPANYQASMPPARYSTTAPTLPRDCGDFSGVVAAWDATD